jgi:hypothetical protein
MSDRELKRPQRILSAEQVGPTAPAQPPRPTALAADRFGRLLIPTRASEATALLRSPAHPASAPASAASKRAANAQRRSEPQAEPSEDAPHVGTTAKLVAERVERQVDEPLPMSWSQAEKWHRSWRESAEPALPIELAQAQRWPEDVAAAATLLCQRAGDQFTGWRIAVPLDSEALPETELWLEASPQRLSLRFQTLSSWSVRLICLHQERLVALLAQRLGPSREVDIEIT